MGWMVMLALLLNTTIISASKYDSCKKTSITWNTVDARNIVMNVTTFEQCWEVCREWKEYTDGYVQYSCNHFTWNKENHPYFSNTCILFSRMGDQEECEECVSAAKSCLCDSPVACKDTGTNLLFGHILYYESGLAPNFCNLHTECSNFTCFTANHKYSNLCLFYSECSQVDATCSGCCSGTRSMDPCQEYMELSSKKRNVKSSFIKSSYKKGEKEHVDYNWTDSRYSTNMPDWKGKGWYRFTGEAGEKMAESFPGFNKCGIDKPAYLLVNEEHQLPVKGRGKTMDVCKSPSYYKQESDCVKQAITVMNCGDYFVYELGGLSSNGYCGASEAVNHLETKPILTGLGLPNDSGVAEDDFGVAEANSDVTEADFGVAEAEDGPVQIIG